MELLSSDVIGLNNIEPILEHNWPDPGEIVAHTNTKLVRTLENEPQWNDTVDLIVRGLTGNATSRRRVSARMVPLLHSNLLTENESEQIAAALWSERHTPKGGLPANTRMYDWEFLSLPELTPALAQEKFIAKWLHDGGETGWQHKNTIERFGNSANGLNHDTTDVDSRLWQIGEAILSLRSSGKQLTLSDKNEQDLVKLVGIWADATIPEFAKSDHPVFSSVGQAHKLRIRAVSSTVPVIMSRIEVSESLGEKLYAKMQALLEYQMPALALAAGLAKVIPNHIHEVATALRIGVTSDDYQLATNAVSGIHQWLEAASDPGSKVPQPPDDLVREIGIAIASRRNTVIVAALQLATWIFENGQKSHKVAIQQLVEDGLRYLAQELRYDREHENPYEVPIKRLNCAELAAAIAKYRLDESPAAARWLEIARDDPLPEVRDAVAKQRDVDA